MIARHFRPGKAYTIRDTTMNATFCSMAPVIGGIPEPLADRQPQQPVSVLIMNGTEDPFVPYGGGPITVRLFPLLRRRRLPDRGYVAPCFQPQHALIRSCVPLSAPVQCRGAIEPISLDKIGQNR